MTMPPLTRRQREILDFFQHYSRAKGMSPTLEEIANNFGVHKVTIFGHVAELERKGVLARAGRNISRGLQITRAAARTATRSSAHPTARIDTRVPILGNIAAGKPIEAIEEPTEFAVEDLLAPGKELYALRVQGSSMIEDGIFDGDIVLVERRSEAKNGETVVAILPDEAATLKRFYKEGKRIRLQPANKDLKPVYVSEVTIRGVVIGVVRRF